MDADNKEAPSNSDDEFITKDDLAKKLKVTTKTIEDWTKLGYIPAIKMPRAVRYYWPDVKATILKKIHDKQA